MACGSCGGGRGRSGRALRTSGDYAAPQPLAVLGADEPAPEGATFRVVQGGQVAYFGDHVPAFEWQQANGGNLFTA